MKKLEPLTLEAIAKIKQLEREKNAHFETAVSLSQQAIAARGVDAVISERDKAWREYANAVRREEEELSRYFEIGWSR